MVEVRFRSVHIVSEGLNFSDSQWKNGLRKNGEWTEIWQIYKFYSLESISICFMCYSDFDET